MACHVMRGQKRVQEQEDANVGMTEDTARAKKPNASPGQKFVDPKTFEIAFASPVKSVDLKIQI